MHWLVLVLAAPDLPPPRSGRLVAARAATRRPRRALRPWRSPRRTPRRCVLHSSPACCRRARSSRCSASSPGSWRRRRQDRPVGARQRRARRGDRPPTLRRRRLVTGQGGAPAVGRRARRSRHWRRRCCGARAPAGRPPSARSSCSSSPEPARRDQCGRRGAVCPRRPGGGARPAPPSPGSCEIGLESRDSERAVLALVAFGLVCAATRRATLFQVLSIVLVENGLALAALELPGGSSSLSRSSSASPSTSRSSHSSPPSSTSGSSPSSAPATPRRSRGLRD